MNVSSSKFTFSLLAITALLVGVSGIGIQEADASVIPTFRAIHNSTTTTEIVFIGNTFGVNGTGTLADWKVNGVVVTAITNGTANHANFDVSHYGGNAVAVFNRTHTIMLTHADIGTSEVTVQYIKTGDNADIRSSQQVGANDTWHQMAAATNTGIDQVPPTASSAKLIDSKRIQVTMSENISNFNSTASDFTLNGAPGVSIGSIVSNNGTGGTSPQSTGNVIYLTTDKPISNLSNYLTLDYGNRGGEVRDSKSAASVLSAGYSSLGTYITDDTHSYKYFCSAACDDNTGKSSNSYVVATGQLIVSNGETINLAGVGNRLANFTGLIIENGLTSNGQSSSINNDKAPQVTASSVQVNNGFIEALTATNPINVDVEVGDTVTFDFTITDSNGAYTIPSVSLYTNFIDRPDDMNLFYTNNFDTVSQESTSYYEWNVRSDDVAYDYSNTVSWNPAIYSIIDSDTIEVSLSFNVDNTMDPTEVWLQVGDTSYNIDNHQLPLTLDVTGDELLNFENTGNQKLLGFLNESVLSSIVSGWTNSNDNLANVEELSSALGVQDQVLPAWTTNLANWVVNDDIYAADMIVAVEYIINQ